MLLDHLGERVDVGGVIGNIGRADLLEPLPVDHVATGAVLSAAAHLHAEGGRNEVQAVVLAAGQALHQLVALGELLVQHVGRVLLQQRCQVQGVAVVHDGLHLSGRVEVHDVRQLARGVHQVQLVVVVAVVLQVDAIAVLVGDLVEDPLVHVGLIPGHRGLLQLAVGHQGERDLLGLCARAGAEAAAQQAEGQQQAQETGDSFFHVSLFPFLVLFSVRFGCGFHDRPGRKRVSSLPDADSMARLDQIAAIVPSKACQIFMNAAPEIRPIYFYHTHIFR